MNDTRDLKSLIGLTAVIILILSAIVANRDLSIGADTVTYIRQFEWVSSTGWLTRHEPGFSLITWIIGQFTFDYKYFLAIIFILTNIGLFLTLLLIYGKNISLSAVLMFLGILLFSSWYEAATLNGLRQGASLPYLYASYVLFAKRRYTLSAVLLAFSATLHLSSILAAPFFILARTSNDKAFIVFIFSATLYYFGISEIVVSEISNALSISFYQDIVSYGEGGGGDLWVGFQLQFFLYSVFWGVLYYVMKFILRSSDSMNSSDTLNAYIVMIMPYFYFAHGAFSNRFALIGWLFIPYLHSIFALKLPLIRNFQLPASLLVSAAGLTYYCVIVLGYYL